MHDLRARFPDYAQGNAEASRRKIERDKAQLAEVGIILEYHAGDGDGPEGYTINRSDTYLPKLRLEPEEHMLLALAARSALLAPTFPHRRALRLALAKLETDSDQDASPFRFTLDYADTSQGLQGKIETISAAITRRKYLSITYERPGAEPTERRVDPHGAFLKQGVWYLVGHDHRSGERRTFRVSRITSLRMHASRPSTPDFDAPEDFDLRQTARLNALRFPIHQEVEVVIRVDEEVWFLVERAWQVPPDSSGHFRVRTTNTAALIEQVLRLGLRAEVISPTDVRERIREALDAVISSHEVTV